jgi:pantoate--beta-alanine ligase
MTQIIKKVSDLKSVQANLQNLSVGFVPTMGALHQGHIDIVKRAKQENDISFVSIYVNPTQFNNKEDFEKYPLTFESDLEKLNKAEIDFLFYPSYQEIYPDDFTYKVQETSFSQKLCGAQRPGHFDGVLTVVLKLLNLVKPNKCYFGEKDYQQYLLIREMARAFFMDVEIVAHPTVRNREGLALSSRNVRLSEEGLKKANLFAKTLTTKRSKGEVLSDLKELNIDVEYLEEIENRRVAAIYVEGVRLIDNVQI